MNRARLIILVLTIPLFGFTCAYHVRDISVAPSYKEIAQGQHGLNILVRDYDSVVSSLKKWAIDSEFSEGQCPPTRSNPDFGSTSPGKFYLCGVTTTIETVMYPEYNSTRVSLYDPKGSDTINKLVPELKSYLKTQFGEGAVIEHHYN